MDANLTNSHKRSSGSDSFKFSKFSYDDIPQISNLLVTIWPILYGAVGHPLFSEDYLRWIYGGPNKEKHVMVGAWLNHDLIAYQSFLYRRVFYGGKTLNAYLWTHATVSPRLAPSERVHCAIQMMKQGVLFDKNSRFYVEDCDLVYAFNEVDSHTREVVDKVLKKHFAIDRKINSVFNQFIILPNKLKKYVNEISSREQSFDIRIATEKESDKLANLLNQVPQGAQFVMQMTEDELRHYFFSRPDHHTYAAYEEGNLRAFIHFFTVQIIKETKAHLELIVEFIISDPAQKNYAAHLLLKAVDVAEKINAKAVVFENANFLDFDAYQPMGLMPTLRKMTMSAFSREGSFDYSGTFRCDVK